MPYMRFAKRLRKLRKEAGITQEEMARDLGVTRSTVANWENCIRKPGIRTIKYISEYFDVPYGYMYSPDTKDVSEIDLSVLNKRGKELLKIYYKGLISDKKYTKF